jgi:hypothetical protein
VIAHAVAYRLAAQAETVSSALRAGDGCAARDAAAKLAANATAAISAGAVPRSLQAPLTESVSSLESRITCAPPTPGPKPHPPKPADHPKHHHHGDGSGDGGG